MSFLHFIVNDVLGQASILISLIAMIGLIALKKSPGQIITGTLKTLLGFLVLLSGAGIIGRVIAPAVQNSISLILGLPTGIF